jgi:hypothetical protein
MTHTTIVLTACFLSILTIATVIYNESEREKKEVQRRQDMYVTLESDKQYN